MSTLSSSGYLDKDKLAVVVRDIWRKLVEGLYKPSDRLKSS